MMLYEAKVVDSTHLELSRPIAVCLGKSVVVAVAEPAERDMERWQWIEAGTTGLQTAYDDAEPEYTPAMIRESNPGYGT
jgi:hypothetical protein